jgi:hypothetical protein
VQDLLQTVLDQAVPSLDDVLSAAGIHLSLLDGGAVTTDSGASAFRSAGLELTFTYKGTEQAALGQLIESIPPELRPSVGPLPNPISFLLNNHIAAVTLGQGTVSALASAPFDSDLGDGSGVDLGGDLPSFTDGGGFVDPGFATPIPEVPGSSDREDLGGTLKALASGAVPAAALVILIIGAGLLSIGTTRLADNVLAPVTTSCPSGLDQPPAPPRDP